MYKNGDAFNQETRNRKEARNKIEYNDRTYQSYIDAGFGDLVAPGSSYPLAHQINAPRERILRFLNECDTRKGPVERTVTAMYQSKSNRLEFAKA